MEKEFTKPEGTTEPAAYVDVIIEDACSSTRLQGRIDTGADVTVVPRWESDCLIPNKKQLLIRNSTGNTRREQTYRGWIKVEGKAFWLENIILRDAPICLIGMDIINRMELLVANGTFILE